jgi:hypothetical protein
MPSFLSRYRIFFLILALGFAIGGWGQEIPKSSVKRIESRLEQNLHLRSADVMKVYLPLGCRISAILCLVAAFLPQRSPGYPAADGSQDFVISSRQSWVALGLCLALGANSWPRMG